MKVAILAGGQGTRLLEETVIKPKPMVEIGARPLLWHIMKFYAAYGYTEFVIALGYKGDVIKDYFLDYHSHAHSLTVKVTTGEVLLHDGECEDWTVHLLDTGLSSNTGGRVKKIAEYIGKEPFLLTYGDGVSNVNIPQLVNYHREKGKLVTLTAVRPSARFGQLHIRDGQVVQFAEKHQADEGWINGGFFVLQPEITDYVVDDRTSWESEALEKIAADGQLAAFRHDGFWQSMDSLRDANTLERIWQEGNAPWKIWA
jgi:glucose-1-phosphate cytidylyltransferase